MKRCVLLLAFIFIGCDDELDAITDSGPVALDAQSMDATQTADATHEADATEDAPLDGGNIPDAQLLVDAGPDADPVCPCFTDTELGLIEESGGTIECHVDLEGGGTTISGVFSSFDGHRYVATAFQNDAIPDTHVACETGCLDDTDDDVDDCEGLPAYSAMLSITMGQYDACRALIVARCPM